MRNIFIGLCAVFLAACSTPQATKVITKTEYIVIVPEMHYFKATSKPEPPAMITFQEGEKPDFEKLYVDLAGTLIKAYEAVDMCNRDKWAAVQDIEKKKQAYGR